MDEEVYIGEIRLFAGKRVPYGWRLCDGSKLKADEFAALYALIGNLWGGDTDMFALPDFRGRVPIGMGQGAGLSARTLGGVGGSETSLAELPPHGHAYHVSGKAADLTSPDGALLGAVKSQGVTTGLYLKVEGTKTPFADDAIAQTGSGLPHLNTMPSLALNYMICVAGMFPEKS